jgi:hypothetical protein
MRSRRVEERPTLVEYASQAHFAEHENVIRALTPYGSTAPHERSLSAPESACE